MRSAAWARSRRRWRGVARGAASRSGRTRACARFWSRRGARSASSRKAARRCAEKSSSRTSIRNCFSRGWSIRRRSIAEFLRRISNWRSGSGTFRMNVALSELPDFSCLPGKARAEHHTSGIIIGPSLAYMDRAYLDARQHGWSKKPIVEMLIPSTLDDTLAPPGQHVASLFCQHVAPELPEDFPGGSSWDDHKETVADLMIDTVNSYAPNFKASVIGRQVLSPLDLERTFGLARRRHLSWAIVARPDFFGAADAWVRRLPRADPGPLYVRLGHASGRRGHRRPGAQCGAGDSEGREKTRTLAGERLSFRMLAIHPADQPPQRDAWASRRAADDVSEEATIFSRFSASQADRSRALRSGHAAGDFSAPRRHKHHRGVS